MRVLKVDSADPDVAAVREAAAVIRAGGLVIFPTETVYGLAANALDPQAVMKVFEAKKRPLMAALPVQVGYRAKLEEVSDELSEAARLLSERWMPGPITLVVRRKAGIPDIVTAGGDTVGVRIPDDPVALAILREVGTPIVATSANVSGEPDPRDAEEAIRQVGAFVEVVLDAGPARYGMASTVVDTTVAPPRILRAGAISADEIRKTVGELVE
ncbi:MAG: L-threonylcarbamoyladenylate synthase [Armatimonadota bacterium]|nr:L-threonylcarbamoyladenylate synthase [Armatimonadota bacterium]